LSLIVPGKGQAEDSRTGHRKRNTRFWPSNAPAVRGCQGHLTQFLQRYLPLFYRQEQRDLATLVIRGRLRGLERKTSEPIAHQAGRPRKPVQHFVGAGARDDEAVMAALRRHVAAELGDPEAVLVVDSSGFPKKGTASCGVARQWCGRLGKRANCQVGVFLSYAAPGGHAPLDRRLFLTPDWAADRQRQAHVPPTDAEQGVIDEADAHPDIRR